MAQRFKRIVENSFILGYNDRDKAEALRTEEGVYMAMILNAWVDENKLIKRTGYSMIANAPRSKSILGQDRHEPFGGTKVILRAIDDDPGTNSRIETWTGSGDWADMPGAISQTAGALHEFVTLQGATYAFNDANDTVIKTTDGASFSNVAAVPAGISGAWFHNFFFVFGVSGQESRLYFSDVNTPETFDAMNGYIDVNPGDNEPIIGLGVLGDRLLIFKESRVWQLTGYGTADFTLDDLGETLTNLGTPARRSIVETPSACFFLSFRGGTPHFRMIRQTDENQLINGGIVSDAITGTMNRLNVNQLANSAGIYDGRHIWWAVTVDSDTTNKEVLVFDTVTGAWVRFTGIEASVFTLSTLTGEPQLYFGDSQASGKSYHLDTSTNDDGDAIDFQVHTPAYYPEPAHKSKFKYLYMTGDVSQDVEIDVDIMKDGFGWLDLDTIQLTGLGAKFGSAVFGVSKFGDTTIAQDRLDTAGGTAYFMQYRFRNNEVDESVTIREWELFHKTRGLRAIPTV